MMFREFFATPRAGRDRNGARAECFSAGDISWRIADDVDLVRGKFAPMLFFRARAGKCSEFVPIVVIVGEGAEFKKMPDTVMTELELCTARAVAGEQSEEQMLWRLPTFEQ